MAFQEIKNKIRRQTKQFDPKEDINIADGVMESPKPLIVKNKSYQKYLYAFSEDHVPMKEEEQKEEIP